jgi:FkbM family methyltransferase
VAAGLTRPARSYVRHAPGAVAKPLLVRRLVEPSLRGRPRPFVTRTVDGFHMAGNTRDMIQRYLYVFGVWEPELSGLLRSRLRPGRTFIDVGANIGYFSLLASGLVGAHGRVVAFEPLPETYEQLRANLERNAARNVRALNVAAGRAAGVVTLYGGDVGNSGTTTMVADRTLHAVAQAAVRPLDDLLTEDEVATARLVKIDVEGAEPDVVAGLCGALDAMPDDVEVVVEISPGADAARMLELFASRGFGAYHLRNDYRLTSYARRTVCATAPRLRGPVTERMDVVLSRTDVDELAISAAP